MMFRTHELLLFQCYVWIVPQRIDFIFRTICKHLIFLSTYAIPLAIPINLFVHSPFYNRLLGETVINQHFITAITVFELISMPLFFVAYAICAVAQATPQRGSNISSSDSSYCTAEAASCCAIEAISQFLSACNPLFFSNLKTTKPRSFSVCDIATLEIATKSFCFCADGVAKRRFFVASSTVFIFFAFCRRQFGIETVTKYGCL